MQWELEMEVFEPAVWKERGRNCLMHDVSSPNFVEVAGFRIGEFRFSQE